MADFHLSITQKSVLYASKTLLGAAICWYGLLWAGVPNPIWAVITVMIVSDPDLSITRTLAKTRVINTLVGCSTGLAALLCFGYSVPIGILTAALTVLLITSMPYYPTNWRLAPATVIILMDAGRLAPTQADEIAFALLRAGEIIIGCLVALSMAGIYTRLLLRFRPAKTAASHPTHPSE